jgi:hypothetical protein
MFAAEKHNTARLVVIWGKLTGRMITEHGVSFSAHLLFFIVQLIKHDLALAPTKKSLQH